MRKWFRVLVGLVLSFFADQAMAGANHSSFYFEPSAEYVFTDGANLAAPLNRPLEGTDFNYATNYGLTVGFQFGSGFVLGMGYGYFLRVEEMNLGRYYPLNSPTSSEWVEGWNLEEKIAVLDTKYRVSLNRRFALVGGARWGYAFQDLRFSNNFGTLPSKAYHARGWVCEPGVAIQFLLGPHWGMDLRGAYRWDDMSPVLDGQGQTLGVAQGSGAGSPWHVVNSGIAVGLGLTYYLGPMYDRGTK